METTVQNLKSTKTGLLFPLALLSASVVTPVYANHFYGPDTNARLNIGSAPNPTPYDLSGDYPLASRSMNEQGRVGLKVSLTQQGTVSGAVVERSSGIPRLDDAAVKYVKANWLYEPSNGQEMPTEVRAVVNFRLR